MTETLDALLCPPKPTVTITIKPKIKWTWSPSVKRTDFPLAA